MPDAPKMLRPPPLRGVLGAVPAMRGSAIGTEVDPRVSMVLSVLGGRSVDDVSREWDVEPTLLHRWLRDFLTAGSGAVTNQPDPDQERQRDRFMAALAHELRTPLAVARGWAMALAEGDVPPGQVPAALERVSAALDHLGEHVEDVELSASASLGRSRPEIEALEVAELSRDLNGAPVPRKGGDLTVHADRRFLVRVLKDLWRTGNREPAPHSVAIEVVRAGAWDEIRVVREGNPIGPLVIQALLDPFDANDDATGVTVGLYLARALVVAHGGHLGAEGDDETTVLFARLPHEPPSSWSGPGRPRRHADESPDEGEGP
ncbi:MAG: HAMP domain-containing histidine kinase [Marmoricola sp.]|nr:HAMP domain-containing histidine kinase [Marmoricola sp.]